MKDMSIGFNIFLLKEIISSFDFERTNYHINEILEFYNILIFVKNKLYIPSDDQNVIEKLKEIIGKFFNQISDNNFIELYSQVDEMYISDFWDSIEKFKSYNDISIIIFDKLLKTNTVFLLDIFYNKFLTEYYKDILRERLLSEPINAEILLSPYVKSSNSHQKPIYLPSNLTFDDKENIIENYVNLEEANINYLNIIINFRDDKDLRINPRTKLKAKTKYDNFIKNHFLNNRGIEQSINVEYINGLDSVKQVNIQGLETNYFYSRDWFVNNNDYPTLLNNFIYIFDYTDLQMRITLVSKRSEMGIIESKAGLSTKDSYQYGISFLIKNRLAYIQMYSYIYVLKSQDIRIEDIFEWFFNNYLLDEFNIANYNVNLPSEHSSYLEKCRIIFPEIERVLKKYNIYVEDGYINDELLQFISKPLQLNECKSNVINKYVYSSNSEEYNFVVYLLFSNLSLTYTNIRIKRYDNFYNLIINERIKPTDLKDYNQNDIKWLIDKQYIYIDNNGFMKLSNVNQILILKDIFYNDVISYWHHPKKIKMEIEKLVNKGLLKFENSLFTSCEADYLNFLLNKRYSNGIELRNLYSHGVEPNTLTDDVHEKNYIKSLIVLVLIILKINDDLSILHSSDYHKYSSE